MRKFFVPAVMLLCSQVLAYGQHSAIDSLAMYHEATALNSGKIQQEMIYLHLDNTSYYRGDRIFFACYLVTSGHLKPSNLSQTVYVELLNPNGKIIDRCVLKSEDGRCHGSLLADETPFYSGYYEIRAYTRYMLNFGPEAIFSRVIPIYAPPQKEGDWSERTILTHDPKTLPMQRPKPHKIDKVELKFYPEGGHLVNGLPARVAFELTDEKQRPLKDIAGRIVDRTNDSIVATFRSRHMGRGSVEFTPQLRRYSAEMTIDGKRYWCDLPKVEPSGISLRVDNREDSIGIRVNRSEACPLEYIGVSLTCRGELYGRSIVDLSENTSAEFKMPTAKLPTGVCQLTLFDTEGNPIADRLFFHNRHEFVNIDYSFDKPSYRPFEKVELTVKLSDSKTGKPVSAPFSISVTDADNHVAYGSNIMADLLLASEIKGYIHNPSYYFQDGKETELDHLLMVQGWRRYSWRQLAGMEEMRIDSLPERGIEVRGRVLERFRDRPKANISVSAMLAPVDSTNIFGSAAKTYTFKTDSLGRFSLRDSIVGDYMMILSSSNKKKVSNNRILLDHSERPASRTYFSGEICTEIANETSQERFFQVDTVKSEPTINGTKLLKEVEVTAKYTPAWWTAHYKENSVASYNIGAETDIILNNGAKHIRYLTDILCDIDQNFYEIGLITGNELRYNGKEVLYVSDPEFGQNNKVINEMFGKENIASTKAGAIYFPTFNPGSIPVDYIKSVYVNTTSEAIMTYAVQMIAERADTTRMDILMDAPTRFGCVVFVEFHPDKRAKMQDGIRRTTLQGYTSNVMEYYSPNYDKGVPVPNDYRRTVYWNPDMTTDIHGNARIEYFNNSHNGVFEVQTVICNNGRFSGNQSYF